MAFKKIFWRGLIYKHLFAPWLLILFENQRKKQHGLLMKPLNYFCQANSFLKTKIALMTFHNIRYSYWTEKLLVLLEYLQLISQGLYLHTSAIHPASSSQSDTYFSTVILYFAKLANPSDLMPLQTYTPLSRTILLIVFCCMMLKYLLLGYVTAVAYWNWKSNTLLVTLWRWIFKLQTRILCFFMTSFWVNIILGCLAGTFSSSGIDKSAIIGVSSLLIAIEYVFSIFLKTQFNYVLPTQNYLASKGNEIQLATLVQKILLQILQMLLWSSTRAGMWTFSLFNMTLSAIKIYYYQQTLPLYDLKALIYQGELLSIVFSLNLVCFVHTILKAAHSQNANANFIIISWILITMLISKVTREMLVKSIVRLFTSHVESNPGLVVHKVSATKQLPTLTKLPSKRNSKLDLAYLLTVTMNKNIKDIFSISVQSMSRNMEEFSIIDDCDEIFIEYLTNMAIKFPGDPTINLHLAYLCSQDPCWYTKAMKTIAGFKQRAWSQSHLSSLILLHEIEKLKLTNDSNEQNLDVLNYVKSHVFVEDLRASMTRHTNMKIEICDSILADMPNIGQIFNSAQKIDKLKIRTEKMISRLPHTIPDSFIEPLLLCARYHLVLGYSVENHQKYSTLYLQKKAKYDRPFREMKFTEENLYQNSNVFLILSGEKSNNGQIMFASSSIENLCGGKQASYNRGSHISSLFTSTYKAFYADIVKNSFETEGKMLDKIERAFICNKDGYIIETELYMKIHPYISRGLYLDMLIRPVPVTAADYLLVKEDGTIEGATKKIANKLGLDMSVSFNIRQLSEELGNVNQAFNMVTKGEKEPRLIEQGILASSPKSNRSGSRDMDYRRALELYEIYGSAFTKVQLVPVKQAHNTTRLNFSNSGYFGFWYSCKVSILPCGEAIMKLITLETVKEKDDEDGDGRVLEEDRKKEEEILKELEEERDMKEDIDNDFLTGSENIDSPERIEEERVTEQRGDTELFTYGNLISPTTTHRRALISPRRKKEAQITKESPKKVRKLVKNSDDNNTKKNNEFEVSTQPYQNSHDKIIYKKFQKAVAKDFHPKSFNTLCAIFYGVIFVTFASQIILKVVSDNTLQALSIKKALLTYSQLRTYKVLLIQINARGAVNNIDDPSVDKGTTDLGIPIVVTNIRGHQKDLRKYNQIILSYLPSLADDLQKDLFASDIRIFGSYTDSSLDYSTVRNVTSFETVDVIIDTIQKMFGLSVINSEISLPYFNFLVVNSINDFLYKSQEITDLFTDSVNTQKIYLRSTILVCLIVTPLLLVGIIFTLALIVWKQYCTEKEQMVAFTKLKPEIVRDILRRLKEFKANLEDRNYLDRKGTTLDAFPSGVIYESSYHRRHDMQKINYSETRKRYFTYVVQVSCYIAVLLMIMLWNYISALKSMTVLYRRQDQLEFANELSETISVSYCANAELFSSNDTNYVKHQLPSAMMKFALPEIIELQSQIPEKFLEEDRTYDPQIQEMLFFQNNCSQYNFTVALYTFFCNSLIKNGQKVNFVSLVSLYVTIFQQKLRDYETCDKENITTLLRCGYLNTDYFLPSFALIAAEAQLMGQVISANIEDNIGQAYSQRKLFLVIFSVSLIVVGVLIWLQILRKLRNVHNDFKKVVQIFPPNLILSSFLLKNFLKEHSNEFENIKNVNIQRLQ